MSESPQWEEARQLFRNLPDPRESSTQTVDRVVEALSRNFEHPISGGNYQLRLKGKLVVEDPPDPYDYAGIYQKMKEGTGRKSAARGTWGARVKGMFEIVDTKTGKVLDKKRHTLAVIPTPLFDRSYLVNGKKRFVLHQWRRKPGVFSRRNERGDLLTEFNVEPATSSRIRPFAVVFDTSGSKETPDFKLKYGGSSAIPMWDVAKLLGASPKDLKGAVGAEIADGLLDGATDERYERNVRKLFQMVTKEKKDSKDLKLEEIETRLRAEFNTSVLDPSITRATLGGKFDRVNSKSILGSFTRLVDIANGASEDDRESIALKKLLSPQDLLAEAVGRESTVSKFVRGVEGRLRGLSDREGDPRIQQIIKQPFNKMLQTRVGSSMVQRSDDATTPLRSLGVATTTTIMGEGAIGSDMAIPTDAKSLNPGSVAFLDPTHVSEGPRAGVVLNIPVRTKVAYDPGTQSDRELGHSKLLAELISPTGRKVEVSPDRLIGRVIGSSAEWERRKGGGVHPKTGSDGMVEGWRDGQVVRVPPEEVAYWTQDSSNLYDANSILTPFMGTSAGGRIGYADAQTTQHVPLVDREAPLVQTRTPGSKFSHEELLAAEAGAILAPFDGRVTKIHEGGPGERWMEVTEQGKRKPRKIHLAKNIKMGKDTPLDSKAIVKEGDTFTKGQALADSTFTRDGVFAAGINARVGYLPYHTSTFEDAITVSDSFSNRMTSEHLYERQTYQDNVRLGKKHYLSAAAISLPEDEDQQLDADGVIRVGTQVKPGQLIMAGMQSEDLSGMEKKKRQQILNLFKSHDTRGQRSAFRLFENRWDGHHAGEVVDVQKLTDREGNVTGAKVYVRTLEPFQVGDKIYGRNANKGVVSMIIPDAEMPQNEKGEHIEVLYNPAAVPGRINPNQNFETWLGKVAKATGKPEIVENYTQDNVWQFVKDRLKEAGVADGEVHIDPTTGKNLGKVGVGYQYMLKAKQQVDHKSSARGIGNFQESGTVSKGKDGAQRLGELGVYGLLAQDAREFLRDAQLYKSENRPEVWEALASGGRLPPGSVPGSFKRFQHYLKAAGINMEHEKNTGTLRLAPLTDAGVIKLARSGGEDNLIPNPIETVSAKNFKPKKGGLFDVSITGGREGSKWARFEMSTRLPNPVYEGAIKNLLGLKNKDFDAIITGQRGVQLGDGPPVFGPGAITKMLEVVDTGVVEEQAAAIAKTAKNPAHRSSAYRALRSLKMLERSGMTPADAFTRKQVLVLPGNMRGLSLDKDTGDFVVGDVNYLYRDIAIVDRALKEARSANAPPKVISELESGLYDSMRSLLQTEGSSPLSNADYQGIIGIVTGRRPDSTTKSGEVSDIKQSLLRKHLIQRPQILSGRTVLTPRDDLDLHEIAMPRSMGVKVFEPLLEARWKQVNPDWISRRDKLEGFRKSVSAYTQKGERSREVDQVLDHVVRDRWVAVKRDPVLHKYGFQGFKPILTDDETISINPLVFGGLGADNDGDTLAVFAPVTESANRELKTKLAPHHNLFNPSSGELAYGVSHEAILGLNRITRTPEDAELKGSFKNVAAARAAWLGNRIKINDRVSIAGAKTTLGVASVDEVLPGEDTLDKLAQKGVIDKGFGKLGLDKGSIKAILTHVAVNTPENFGKIGNRLRQVGNEAATFTGTTLLMEDFKPVVAKERRLAESQIREELAKVHADYSDPKERQKEIKGVFDRTLGQLNAKGMGQLKAMMHTTRPNVNSEMTFSGARVKPNQLQQLLMGPGAVVDSKGDVVPTPVLRSYTEGQTPTSHWATFHGARMGTISKVIEVQQPGYLTKQVVNTTMDQTVTLPDCGTKRGVYVDVSNPYDDLEGRVLAETITAGGKRWGRNSTLNGNALSLMRRAGDGLDKVRVRSPLTCEADEGICQVCIGSMPNGKRMPLGANFGVQAAQAVGERSVQLTLSQFHSGGVYEPGSTGGARNLFQEAANLLRMPEAMGGQAAILSPYTGKVKDANVNKKKGGWDLDFGDKQNVFIPNDRLPVPQKDASKFFKGRSFETGDAVSAGVANPKAVLEITGGDMDKVRDHMVRSLGGLFAPEGVLRRNIEGVVRGLTGTVEVSDPGGSELLPGQRIPEAQANKLRKTFKTLSVRPLLRGIDVAPREYREDFLARLNYNNLRRSLVESAQTGGTSQIHGTHPIPGLIFGAEFNRRGAGGTMPRTNDGRY
jgi:DNA-directed RNA polymerase subunit beta'